MAKFTKDEAQEYVRELADGTILALLLAVHFQRFEDPKKAASEMTSLAVNLGRKMTFDDYPAETSDYLSQEFEEHLLRRIRRAESLATGTPFDPNASRNERKANGVE